MQCLKTFESALDEIKEVADMAEKKEASQARKLQEGENAYEDH